MPDSSPPAVAPVRLDDVAALPADIASRLKAVDSAFLEHDFIESVADDPRVRPLVDELEEHLRQSPVLGYHCTREPMPGYFARKGLRLTDVCAHQAEFLKLFGDRFTRNELQEMQAAWKRYFESSGQIRARDGRIWFCLTEKTARSDGTQAFFQHFGGEAIFMPLKGHQEIARKLGTIGSPVIVQVRLPPGSPAPRTRLALPMLSAYHLTRRADAVPWQAETDVKHSIDALDVIAVTPL